MFNKKNILGVGITNAKKVDILEYVVKSLVNSSEKYFIVTPNPEILVMSQSNKGYKKVLNSAKLALPDGVGVLIAGKLLGEQLSERITGVDMVESLCKRVDDQPITVGFLGGGPGVAVRTADCLRKICPNLKIDFVDQGNPDKATVNKIMQKMETRNKAKDQKKRIDILFVAFGSPKQEIWISENLEKLPVRIAIGVGGAFDFISGKIKRAPFWVRNLGLEWLFRLILEPWRIKRQILLAEFIFLILKESLARVMYNRKI